MKLQPVLKSQKFFSNRHRAKSLLIVCSNVRFSRPLPKLPIKLYFAALSADKKHVLFKAVSS